MSADEFATLINRAGLDVGTIGKLVAESLDRMPYLFAKERELESIYHEVKRLGDIDVNLQDRVAQIVGHFGMMLDCLRLLAHPTEEITMAEIKRVLALVEGAS